MIERAHTCYGPGDRVVVMATVKSDTVHTVMLRGFEFMLRETTVFRAGPQTQGKKGSPQVKVASVGEQKVPVNATLYGGTHHKAELSVTIPSHHTSATINAARHIDITYVLTVKALMSTGQPVSMDLPVMISNWTRCVAIIFRGIGELSDVTMQNGFRRGDEVRLPRQCAVFLQMFITRYRRIGHAFNVSLPGQTGAHHNSSSQPEPYVSVLTGKIAPTSAPNTSSGRTNSSHGYSNSIDKKSSVPDLRSPKSGAIGPFATSPISSEKSGDRFGLAADEFGARPRKGSDNGHSSFAAQTIGALNMAANSAASSETNSVPVARPRSSNGRTTNPTSRLTIANLTQEEIREHMEAEAELARSKPAAIIESPVDVVPPMNPITSPAPAKNTATPKPKTSSSSLGQKWASAEDEKKRLYERAVANVERVQKGAIRPSEVSTAPSRTAWFSQI